MQSLAANLLPREAVPRQSASPLMAQIVSEPLGRRYQFIFVPNRIVYGKTEATTG